MKRGRWNWGEATENGWKWLSGLSPGEKYAAKNSFVLKADLGKSGGVA
ncbi:MAG: hypothetical protein MPW16_20865 (plasmid) [Candidatus Manganitrophus sp.]|nr:MAG: hypothetical protein MPW16_20865 [Candidatus Manganitrophus sp.]